MHQLQIFQKNIEPNILTPEIFHEKLLRFHEKKSMRNFYPS
ncbi:hypothetical protein [Methanobrevibacter arboriphilus]|nr:hypothetical protein [Methanobrevibacter arboriphilus]